MAALTLRRPLASSDSFNQTSFWLTDEPQGAEDKQLRNNAQLAIAHWKSRAECVLNAEKVGESYVSVPFKPVNKVRVTYRLVGALKPAPYPLDE